MKIHLPNNPNSHTNRHETVAPGSVLGDWQLDRQIPTKGCEQRLLQYRAAPEGTPTNFDYLLHTPADPESESAFSLLQREHHISQQFSNPHLLPVLDVHLETTPYFIVTPHLPGSTLRDVLQTRGKLELYHALWLLRQTTQAVAALHSHGWSMPSLRTENLQIEPDGHLTLSEVGHARRIESDINASVQIHADTCRLAGLFIEMTTGDLADISGNSQDNSSRSCMLPDGSLSSVMALLREMLNPRAACDKHSLQFLVERLVRLEINLLARPA